MVGSSGENPITKHNGNGCILFTFINVFISMQIGS